MANLQDIINLSKADGGKFFVMDEKGEAKLVIMSLEDYQRLLLGKLQKQVEDVEKINQEIIQAQIAEQKQNLREDFRATVPRPYQTRGVDLREEVIDPSFDFEGPKVGLDDF